MKRFLGYMVIFLLILFLVSGAIWYFVLHKRPISLSLEENGTIVFHEPSVLSPEEYAYVDQGIISGGEMREGVVITRIRFGIHPRFERLVLQTEYAAPSRIPLKRPGYFELVRNKEKPDTLQLKLYHYLPSKAPLPSLARSELIEKISFPHPGLMQIKLKKPALFKAYTLTAPARIVIDFEPLS